MDSYLHVHQGTDTSAQMKDFGGVDLHLINVHSLYMYNNFFNISQEIGNDDFVYQAFPQLSTSIPDGNYTLQSFNKYLASNPATSLFRVNPRFDGMGYEVDKYANASDRANDVNRQVQAVDTLSKLNKEIKTGLVWTERIRFHCDVIKGAANEYSGTIQSDTRGCDYVLIPITASPGSHQLFSFQTEMSFEYNSKASLRVYFTREDGTLLRFPSSGQETACKIQFTFIEGQHLSR